MSESGLQQAQYEVQRLLGRCMLLLQQYERLMKAVVAHRKIEGDFDTLQENAAARIKAASSKTLGALTGELSMSVLAQDIDDRSDDSEASGKDDTIYFSMRARVCIPNGDLNRTKSQLKQLVTLRNNLVHHFIDRHDLWSVDGCRAAREELIKAYDLIRENFDQLNCWAQGMDKTRHLFAAYLDSDTWRDFIVNGIHPDGAVYWPAAGIVRCLNEAADELAVDSWTPIYLAQRWIEERHADQRPSKYGCRSWRHVIHQSGVFDLRYADFNGVRTAVYKARSD